MLSISFIFFFCQKTISLNRTFEPSWIVTFLQVINETLRVANLISGVFRRANTDIHFKGISFLQKLSSSSPKFSQGYSFVRKILFCPSEYIIPKGCKIFASFRAVHLNTEHYENARTFDPWRWQVLV